MQEIKRLVTALQKNEAEKIATPANWQPGDDIIPLQYNESSKGKA